jgi:hypothetical protein
MMAQAWICPKCYDDHRPDLTCDQAKKAGKMHGERSPTPPTPIDRPGDPEASALAEAMSQLLDDMGPSGLGVCLAAKAKARIAYEPFIDPDEREFIMPLQMAQEIVRQIG